MPRLIGTKRDDTLFANSGEDWVIRGRAGNDYIEGLTGNDVLWGDLGDDEITDYNGGYNYALGAKGNDRIDLGLGEARGGLGNDWVSVGWGIAVGGKGDDQVGGEGDLYGDEGPGLANTVFGNDEISTWLTSTATTYMHGGLGADKFWVSGAYDGVASRAEIMDFTAGQDRIGVSVPPPDGVTPSAHAFDRLDANDDGVLNWADSLSGGAVYFNGQDLILGVNWTFAAPTSNDIEDRLIVHNTAQITAADWLMA